VKVLLINNSFQRYGGEEACAAADCELLRMHGHEVVVYSRHNQEISGYNLIQLAALPISAMYSLRTRDDIRSLVSQHKPDVAYVHNSFPLMSPSLYRTLRSFKVPTVQVLGSFRLLCPNGCLYLDGHGCTLCAGGNYLHAVAGRCYRHSRAQSAAAAAVMSANRKWGAMKYVDAYACVSHHVKAVFESAGIAPAKLFVRPNFLDISGIAPNYAPGEYALFLGRLSEEKGLQALLNAFRTLPEVPLKIIGTGPLEGTLRNQIMSCGLRNLQLLGFKQGPEKWDLLRGAAFVIVPSVGAESFGIVALEAYAAGKPVIASETGGLAELVSPGETGFLVEPGNSTELAKAVRRLAACPERITRFGCNGRRLVETRYSPAQSYQHLSRILTHVTALSRYIAA
jgi:glycosyltransferase involved in cell wall biosynthesis